MNLFEWLFEKDNLNPVGDIKERQRLDDNEPINWFILIIGQLGFWFLAYQIVIPHYGEEDFFRELSVKGGLLIAYSWLGYITEINPEYDNMGWFGIFNNPFRYTDNLNRYLFFFKIVLLPGAIMGASFMELSRWFKK